MKNDVTRRWSLEYFMREAVLMNVYNSYDKFQLRLDAYAIGKDYKCFIILRINGPIDSYSDEILWRDLNEYPDDYGDEIVAIDRHLKMGGLLLSFMYETSKKAIEEAKK